MLNVIGKLTPMQICTQNLFPIPVVEVTVERKTFKGENFRSFAVSEASVKVFPPNIVAAPA